MYKYLTRKLENTKGITIDDFTLIALEVVKDSKSNLIQDFQELEPKEITEVLEWKETQEVFDLITDELDEGGNIAGLMYRYNKSGYLARVHIPKPSKLGKGHVYSQGLCYVRYIYANTMCELIDEAIKIGNVMQDEFIASEEKEKDFNDNTNNKSQI